MLSAHGFEGGGGRTEKSVLFVFLETRGAERAADPDVRNILPSRNWELDAPSDSELPKLYGRVPQRSA
jgi:hypothetical protein